MALALYFDEHMPKPILLGLRLQGVNVLSAQEDGQRHTDDGVLLDRAAELSQVRVSFDADMLRHAVLRQQQGHTFFGVILGHLLRLSVGECIRDLELLAKVGQPGDLDNQIVYLPL
jgi:hypothetical protein